MLYRFLTFKITFSNRININILYISDYLEGKCTFSDLSSKVTTVHSDLPDEFYFGKLGQLFECNRLNRLRLRVHFAVYAKTFSEVKFIKYKGNKSHSAYCFYFSIILNSCIYSHR